MSLQTDTVPLVKRVLMAEQITDKNSVLMKAD